MSKNIIRNGIRLALFGGYVSWDGRGKDQHGYPIRRQKEVRVYAPASISDDDCGKGTARIVRLFKEKVEGKVGIGKNVEVRESWRY